MPEDVPKNVLLFVFTTVMYIENVSPTMKGSLLISMVKTKDELNSFVFNVTDDTSLVKVIY